MRTASPRYTSLAAALFLGGLAGCAPSVEIPSPQVSLPPSFEQRAQTGAPASGQLTDQWWNNFNDAQLSQLIGTALERSTTIRLAYARIDEARAFRNQSRAATLPTGSLTGTVSRQGNEGLWGTGVDTRPVNSAQLSFSPSWEIDLFGRLDAIRDRADADAAASAFDFEGVRLSLAADVAFSLFQARLLAAQLGTAQETRDIATQLATAARIGNDRGLTSGQDVARLDTEAASASAEVERLDNELQIAKRSLLILTGTPTEPTTSLAIEPVLANPPALPASAPSTLLARRPDVRSAAASLQAAILTAEIDRLALFPRFTIQPGIGLSTTSLASGGGTGLWSLAAGLALPVLDRARLLAGMRVSEARGVQAAIQYEQTVQSAFGEAENTLARVYSGQRRVTELETAAGSAEKAFAIARRSYQAGLIDLTTFLQVGRTWLQARNARDAGRATLLSDTVSAIRALGGGWDEQSSEVADLIELFPDGTTP
ncbi:MAG: efflux transporter outer membrane subunit [Novosphingobium sp.]